MEEYKREVKVMQKKTTVATNIFRAAIIDLKLGAALPVTWDAAHVLNLGVLDVKDSKTLSGTNFQRFIKRCNVFNNILRNVKGFAFLQLVDPTARQPVAYATQ